MESKFIKKLNLPETLDLPECATFGVEIEFEDAGLSSVKDKVDEILNDNAPCKDWILKCDLSCGGEVVSPVLKDRIESYKKIKTACEIIKSCGGNISSKCAGHIHIGSNLLKDDIIYYLRLARLWTIFENEIVRFGLGEDENIRETMAYYSASSANLLRHIELLEQQKFGKCDFENFVRCFGFEKKLALSFYYLNKDKVFHTLEVRCPNGTLNPDIWKNNINFFVKFLVSCTDDSKDWDLIEKMFQEEKGIEFDDYFDVFESIEKADILSSFVFDKKMDKENFMLQYRKDSDKYQKRY